MKLCVWHFDMMDDRFREEMLFIKPRHVDAWPRWPSDYTKVAEVEVSGEDLDIILADYAYGDTQNESSAATWLVDRHRSSAPGDIVEFPDGKALRVLFLGWQEISVLERLAGHEVADAK